MCLVHGFIPKTCLNTELVPIVKNKSGDARDIGNYRPIAIATVISKLFERVVLCNIEHCLVTNDNQFGFKSKHSTDMCIFLLKQAISYYVKHGSPMFAVFLDASKAFDRVNHSSLFKKLIQRNVPMCFVRLLESWYGQQLMQVRWDCHFSQPFSVSNGVKQGGVLSPYFFAVYMDDLSNALNKVEAGCYIGNLRFNHLMFADDICCICPSVRGLQKILDVCELYACSHDNIFNC